ncbi:MAG: nucleotidyltransferase substrate binding protein [Prevotella sp.]|nr:nucleotidyltransferase substrate binding protein [Prevotella sp.]
MENLDIRWRQRFDNYRKALALLNQAAEIVARDIDYGQEVSDLIREGLIQRFEYTHELAWNVMKDYAAYQGFTDIRGSRDAIRYALSVGLADDRNWMRTIEDRNLSSHHYDSLTADAIMTRITGTYLPLFNNFKAVMEGLQQ